MTDPEEIVDAMNALHGSHPGFRAAHAKGTMATGSFAATAAAGALTTAPHLQGDPIEVTARLSNGSGNPHARDAAPREGRGLAIKFHLPGGEATDIVSISIPVFFVRTAEDFLAFVRARIPDPETGEMDMERIGAFIAEHPETQAALERILPALAPPASFATTAYNSLHAFALLDGDGERRWVRFRWEPEAGEEPMPEEEIEGASRNVLQEEIRERLAAGPVAFALTAILAAEGDPHDDPTAAWPEDRETVELGRLELTEVTEEEGVIVFDPNNLTEGIEASDDAILAARSPAYSVSAERRGAAVAES